MANNQGKFKRPKKNKSYLSHPAFMPTISSDHCDCYRWLLKDAGYTVSYLSLALDIPIQQVSSYFRRYGKFTINQVSIIIVLLKGVREPAEVLQSMLLDVSDEVNKPLKHLYDSIELPESSEVPKYRPE